MSGAVTLENVSKRFVLHHHKARSFQDALVNLVHRRNGSSEEFWALKNVSVAVAPGETLGIIGENGSGKSTVLKLITRILEPTEGRVAVQGTVSALIELGAGFHPDLTGRENIYLNGSILGFSRTAMSRKLDEIIAFSELERFIDTPVKHYSSGMYMRLGFAVAISVDPDILIIDEVLAVGDEVFQRKCFDRIAEFRRRGKTIIFVSHALPMVEQLCDRVVWLHHGEVRGEGPAPGILRGYLDALQRHDEENREAERRDSPATQRGPAGCSGDGLAVRGVELRSADGRETYSFRTGETLVLRLRYRADAAPAEYVVGLELRRHDGLLIHRSTERCTSPWRVEAPGEGFVDVEIADLALLSGTYDVVPILRRIDQPSAGESHEDQRCSFSVWGDAEQTGVVALTVRRARERSESPAERSYPLVGSRSVGA